MSGRLTDVALSAIGLFAIGYLLWPPRRVYWTAVADLIGPVPTMVIVFLTAGLVGVAVAAASDVRVVDLGLGGAAAYLVGMTVLEAAISADSPVHLYLYAALLCCLLAGAIAWRRRPRGAARGRAPRSS